jgi:PHD/YefM family antitoxin component YafN of YafNO toxin-antitoxin module
VTVTGEPVIILGQKSNAVLVGEGVWIAINEARNLLSVQVMHESIAEGMRKSIGYCASELNW